MASFGKLLKKISTQSKISEGSNEGNSTQETAKKIFGSKLGGLQTKLAAGQILGKKATKCMKCPGIRTILLLVLGNRIDKDI